MRPRENPIHVSSPLRARVSVDQICQDCELGIFGDSAHCGPSGHRHVKEYVSVIGYLMTVSYACDCVWLCVGISERNSFKEGRM